LVITAAEIGLLIERISYVIEMAAADLSTWYLRKQPRCLHIALGTPTLAGVSRQTSNQTGSTSSSPLHD
jgi:hypothetical protein